MSKILLELKAIRQISDTELSQAFNDLKATGLQLAIVFNFSAPEKLEWKRLVRSIP